MNFASVNQSDKQLTENLYSETFNDSKKVKTTEAIDMEKYNESIINQQMETIKKNRNEVEKDAKNRILEYNKTAQDLKDRYSKFLENKNNNDWSYFQNHWYWKSYFENINKSGYSEMDNYLDNLKPERYIPIELKNGYQKIGTFDEHPNDPAPYIDNNEMVYVSNTGEYVYDYVENKINPKDKQSIYDENSIDGIKQKISESVDLGQLNGINDLVFKLKDLQTDSKSTSSSTDATTSSSTGSTTGSTTGTSSKGKLSTYTNSSIGIDKTKTKNLGQLNGVNNIAFGLKDLQGSATSDKGVNMSSPGAPISAELFDSIDPKLAQIYQKTMTPNEYKQVKPIKRNLFFNYIYCIIFMIFLYFVFKSE
jgi:hypothetical protein